MFSSILNDLYKYQIQIISPIPSGGNPKSRKKYGTYIYVIYTELGWKNVCKLVQERRIGVCIGNKYK